MSGPYNDQEIRDRFKPFTSENGDYHALPPFYKVNTLTGEAEIKCACGSMFRSQSHEIVVKRLKDHISYHLSVMRRFDDDGVPGVIIEDDGR